MQCTVHLDRYHDFLGIDVRNAAVPDPFEVIIQPTCPDDAVMVATFKEVATCGQDATTGPYAWNSPGSSYDDWYDGSAVTGRLIPRVSHGILEVNDPIFRSLPSFEKSRILAAAYCAYATARGRDGQLLYEIICSMNGTKPEALPSSISVKITDGTSVKRLSHHTSSTTHTILAYPNMTGAVFLSVPNRTAVHDDTSRSKLEHLANASHTNISIKAIQNVARLFAVMKLAGNPSARPGDTTLFGVRPGTVIRLDATIFKVRDRETLSAHCNSIRDRVQKNCDLGFTSMMAFTEYLSSGPMDVAVTTSNVKPTFFKDRLLSFSH
jgi:hypothetical protein